MAHTGTINAKVLAIVVTSMLVLTVLPMFLAPAGASGYRMDSDLKDATASFWGEDPSDSIGFSVTIAGDVNGDGYDDILISSPGDDDGGSNAGQVYLFLGKASGWSMDTDLSDADASFIGEEAYDARTGGYLLYTYSPVAGAGDVNGDGYDDFLIGAPGSDANGSSSGQAYLILGKASGWSMDTDLNASDASFWGEDTYDLAGTSVAGAGDVNGDGYDDILVGAPGDDDGGYSAGQVYLILGKASGWSMDTSLNASDASFWGEDAYDMYYSTMEMINWAPIDGAGDVNGDGYDDILIGAVGDDDAGYGAGQAYLILGKASGWSMDTDLSASDASFWGEDSSDLSGYSVTGVGDVNGDGYDDILIGAPGDEDAGYNAGQYYLILGKASGWSMDTGLGQSDASFLGEDGGDSGFLDLDYMYVSSASGAGDVNKDGYDDILMASVGDDDAGSRAGQVYLVLGKASGWSMDTDLGASDASFWGEDSGDQAGFSVSCGGDVNGDGYDDILIGAPRDEDGGYNAGQTYLIFYESRPTPPEGLAVGLSTDGSHIDLSWETVDYFKDIVAYTVHRSVDGNNYIQVAQVNNTTLELTDTDVALGVTYYYALTASDLSGWTSDMSPPVQVFNDRDTDGDGLGNYIDDDDDGDGVDDGRDDFPLNGTEWQDTDGDGIGDVADDDDDNDGIPDIEDDEPLNPINSIEDELEELAQRLEWIGDNVTAIGDDLSLVNDSIDQLHAEVDALNDAIDAFQNETANALQDIMDRLAALDLDLGDEIDALNQTINDLETVTLKQIEDRLTAIEDKLDTLGYNDTGLRNEIASLKSDIATFKADTDTRLEGIDDLAADIDSLQGDVDDLGDEQEKTRESVEGAGGMDMAIVGLLVVVLVLVLVAIMRGGGKGSGGGGRKVPYDEPEERRGKYPDEEE